MKKGLLPKLLSATMVLVITGIWVLAGTTYSAFNNAYSHRLDLSATSKFSSYFDQTTVGDGTENAPYYLTEEDHFINLEKLVKLGVFDNNTYFAVNADVTFTKTLNPIGTENNPFLSQFDGLGHTLTNVSVASTDYDDVGFFGYVGSGAVVKNILFNNINIVSTGPNSSTDNPLEKAFISSSSSNILTDNGTAVGTAVTFNGATGSTPTLAVPTNATVTDKNGRSYSVVYKSNNKSILSDAGVLSSAVGLKEADKFYTTMDAIIYANYHDGEKLITISYVIQRYQIWIARSATGTLSFDKNAVDESNNKYCRAIPTMFNTESSSNVHFYLETGTGAQVTEVQPVVYTGLAIGHLDGTAVYLGVKKGTITVNTRQQISFSTIVGKSSDDTSLIENKSSTYFQNIDIADISQKMGYVEQDFAATTTTTSALYNDSIKIFNDDQLVIDGGKVDATGIQDTDVARFYGASSLHKNEAYFPITDEDGNIVGYEPNPTTIEGLRYNTGLKAVVTMDKLWGIIDRQSGVQIQNGMSFWASTSSTSLGLLLDIISSILGTNTYDLHISLEITYTVSDCASAIDNGVNFNIVRNNMGLEFATGSIDRVESETFTTISETEAVCSSSNMSEKIQKIKFEDTAATSSSWLGSNTKSIRTPIYALGFKNTAGSDNLGADINIFNVKFSISSANGNTNPNLGNVDFIPTNTSPTYNSDSKTWSNWPSDSNTYIYFMLVLFSKTSPDTSTVVEVTEADIAGGITYVVERSSDSIISGARVNVTYTFGSGTTNSNIIPGDTNGIANITQGN